MNTPLLTGKNARRNLYEWKDTITKLRAESLALDTAILAGDEAAALRVAVLDAQIKTLVRYHPQLHSEAAQEEIEAQAMRAQILADAERNFDTLTPDEYEAEQHRAAKAVSI
jgi:hypothetical protein